MTYLLPGTRGQRSAAKGTTVSLRGQQGLGGGVQALGGDPASGTARGRGTKGVDHLADRASRRRLRFGAATIHRTPWSRRRIKLGGPV